MIAFTEVLNIDGGMFNPVAKHKVIDGEDHYIIPLKRRSEWSPVSFLDKAPIAGKVGKRNKKRKEQEV